LNGNRSIERARSKPIIFDMPASLDSLANSDRPDTEKLHPSFCSTAVLDVRQTVGHMIVELDCGHLRMAI
jgi:hypothetical protein